MGRGEVLCTVYWVLFILRGWVWVGISMQGRCQAGAGTGHITLAAFHRWSVAYTGLLAMKCR